MLNIQKNNSLTCRKPPMPKKNKQETAVAPEGFPILTNIFNLKNYKVYTKEFNYFFLEESKSVFGSGWILNFLPR